MTSPARTVLAKCLIAGFAVIGGTSTTAPLQAAETGWTFWRGININGPAVRIDGRTWDAETAAKDFECRDTAFENQKVQLRPDTDSLRSRMIRSSRYRADGRNSLTLNRLPRGPYRVFLYVWEDNNSETFDLFLENQAVLTGYRSGPAGTWRRLGPWDVEVSDGALNLECRGGHANLSGLEIWRPENAPVAASPQASATGGPGNAVAQRVTNGLQALYTFDAGHGQTIYDRSGNRLDLKIEGTEAVRWRAGHLLVHSPTRIRSTAAASAIIDSVKRSQEITLEAWLRPGDTKQTGPARIVSISRNPSERNITLGQDEDRYDVRLRTRATSTNGIPSTSTPPKAVQKRLAHVVFTRSREGRVRIYVDGRVLQEGTVGGALDNWSPELRLSLVNELSGDRPWRGELHLVAVYSQALSEQDVARNFSAGSGTQTEVTLADAKSPEYFEAHIAPLLARHCLQCHGGKSQKGRLDLSRRDRALSGGGSGPAIVPGQADESLLWQYVESDEMPVDAPPLSGSEKQLLRHWIAAGAVWSLPSIDREDRAPLPPAGDEFVRRLTVPEYIATVRAAVGVDVETDARRLLPRDLRADGFSNTAYNLNVDLAHVEAYAELAEIIVSRMDVPAFVQRFTRKRRLDPSSMRPVISNMGTWLLRGPLEEPEIRAFLRIPESVAQLSGEDSERFELACRLIVEAMLQSPRFVYRIEKRRDGGDAAARQYELASRLSYILWGAPPDHELMRAAADGELAEERLVREQVERMLHDPRAIDRSRQFVADWLNLGRLEHLRPNPERYPEWSRELADDMRAETLAYFQTIVWEQQRPLSDLFNAQLTFATPRLARHYGLTARGEGLQRYDLADVATRGGLLTQGSVLTIGGDEASMVSRGLFVLHDVLRGEVADPPPGLDTTPVPTKPGLSQRMIAESRIADTKCGGCHVKFEPLAFSLERYDGIGAYREVDRHGNRLRQDGQVVIPGSKQKIAYHSAAEFMDLLAQSERVRKTITSKLIQFALGRPLSPDDETQIEHIHRAAQQNGGTYAAVMKEIVMSRLVQD